MKKFNIVMFSMLFLMVLGASAKDKIFFNSKSNIIGITGNYQILTSGGFTAKFVNNPIDVDMPSAGMSTKSMCEHFNRRNFGKKLLDYLFCYDGSQLSIKLLEERAYGNAQKQDEERANYGVISKDDILKGDPAILEVLKNNFIYFDYPTYSGSNKRKWYVFKVIVTDETLKEIYNSWDDMSKYNQISPKVVFVASGKYKVATSTSASFWIGALDASLGARGNLVNNRDFQRANQMQLDKKNSRRLIAKISKKVPELAIRGQVISRAPFMTNVGEANGVKSRDRMVIYRAKQADDGTLYSSKVATVRACGVRTVNSHLYTFAGGQASQKQGDVAVLRPNHNSSYSILGNYMNHSYGLNLGYDHRVSLSKTGVSEYIMTNIGCSVYDGFQKRQYVTNQGNLVHSPVLFNVGVGYGVGFEFAHCMELVPYFMAQYEGAFFLGKKNKYATDNSNKESVYSNSFRVPVGMKAHINLFYPVQLVVGAEYVFNFKISLVSDKENESNPDVFFYEPMGYKRDGLNLYGGLRFNF